MEVTKAVFSGSYVNTGDVPSDMPHIGFFGRSNAGKSSLIREVLNKRAEVKVSSVPGKTRLINVFLVNDRFYVDDLPGIGYARVSKTERGKMSDMLRDYLLNQKNLLTLFVLCDSSRQLPVEEKEVIMFCYQSDILPVLVRTKVDKLNQKEREILRRENKSIREEFPELRIMNSSVKKRESIFEMWKFLGKLLGM